MIKNIINTAGQNMNYIYVSIRKYKLVIFKSQSSPPHQPLDNLESVDIVITDLASCMDRIRKQERNSTSGVLDVSISVQPK